VAVLLAGSALADAGPGRILLRIVEGDQPAPRSIDRNLRQVFHWPHGTHVLTSRSRLVLRLRGPAAWNRSGITAWQEFRYFIAPTAGGGYCKGDLQGKNAYMYSCVHGPLSPRVRVDSSELAAWRSGGRLVYPPQVLDGTVPKDTAAVTVVRGDGSTRARLSTAMFPDFRYFVVPLTAADAAPSHRPRALVARAADGRVLARTRLGRGLLTTRVVNAGGSTPEAPLGRRRTVRFPDVATPGGGLTAGHAGPDAIAVVVVPSARLVYCLSATPVAAPGYAAQECGGLRAGFRPTVDTNVGVHLAVGYAPAAARSMQVVLADGTIAPVAIRRHVYLAVLRNAWFREGNLPRRLVARDGRGRVVAAYTFRVHRDFPDY